MNLNDDLGQADKQMKLAAVLIFAISAFSIDATTTAEKERSRDALPDVLASPQLAAKTSPETLAAASSASTSFDSAKNEDDYATQERDDRYRASFKKLLRKYGQDRDLLLVVESSHCNHDLLLPYLQDAAVEPVEPYILDKMMIRAVVSGCRVLVHHLVTMGVKLDLVDSDTQLGLVALANIFEKHGMVEYIQNLGAPFGKLSETDRFYRKQYPDLSHFSMNPFDKYEFVCGNGKGARIRYDSYLCVRYALKATRRDLLGYYARYAVQSGNNEVLAWFIDERFLMKPSDGSDLFAHVRNDLKEAVTTVRMLVAYGADVIHDETRWLLAAFEARNVALFEAYLELGVRDHNFKFLTEAFDVYMKVPKQEEADYIAMFQLLKAVYNGVDEEKLDSMFWQAKLRHVREINATRKSTAIKYAPPKTFKTINPVLKGKGGFSTAAEAEYTAHVEPENCWTKYWPGKD